MMKKLTTFQKILLVVMVVCLIIGVGGIFVTMPSSREPTEAELALYGPYDVLWDDLPAAEDGRSKKDMLLDLCQAAENTQLGDNEYESYTSDTLGAYLYKCGQVDQILVSAEGVVFISYTGAETGFSVVLAYGADGLQERSVYDEQKDFLFYESGDTVLIYEHFSNTQTS